MDLAAVNQGILASVAMDPVIAKDSASSFIPEDDLVSDLFLVSISSGNTNITKRRNQT